MYQIINQETGEVFFITDSPRYVKLTDEIWTRCDEDEAECVAVCGERYSIAGRPLVPDALTVAVVNKVDAGQKLNNISLDTLKNAKDVKEIQAAILDIYDAVLDIYMNGVTANT